MDGRERARRQVEDLFRLAAHHGADALRFLLRHAGEREQVLLDVLHRAGERPADLACLRRELARGAQQPLAFRHRLADEVRASVLAWPAVSPIRVCELAVASRMVSISLTSVACAPSLASLRRSASRVKLWVSWLARAAALAMMCSRWRSAWPVTVSNFCASPPSCSMASDIAARSRPSAASKAPLSSLSRASRSFIAARWRSWRPSTNSARAIAASEADSIALAWRSSSTAAWRGASAAALAAARNSDAWVSRVCAAVLSELSAVSIEALSWAARPATVSLARAAASASEPETASMRSRSCVRREATASPRTSARAPAWSRAAIWFSSTSSSARMRLKAPSRPALSASSSRRTARLSRAAVRDAVSSAVNRRSVASTSAAAASPIACPRASAQAAARSSADGIKVATRNSAICCRSRCDRPCGPNQPQR